MKLKKIIGMTAVILTTVGITEQALAVTVSTSGANYFVRPALRVGVGELINGIVVNGATESTQHQGVVGYSESTVNLRNGTVKMYSEEYSPPGGLQTFGSFGERITITGGAGTTYDLSFALEGYLTTFGGAPLINGIRDPRLFYDVGIAIYAPGQADWSNFVGIANDPNDGIDPLLYKYTKFIDPIDGQAEEEFYDISAEVFGSIVLDSNYEVFDIFAYTNVSIWTETGDGLEYFEADFRNTAQFSHTINPNANAYSSSGQFLGLTTPPPPPTGVPAPASFLLYCLGLGLLGYSKRRKA